MAEFQIRHPYHSQGLAAGGSALLDAINRGKVHLAKFILDAGEYDIVNTRDFNGKTPLIRACYIKEEKTRDKAVALLLRRGADVNLRDDLGMTACSYACRLRCNDIVQILVKNNVNPDIADNCGNTALIWSALVGNDVAIEILIRSFRRLGLNVNHVNNDGMTALLVAAKGGFVACASLLAIEGKANLSVRDPLTGMTAEQLARDRGCSIADVMTFSVTGSADFSSIASAESAPPSRGRKGMSLRPSRLSRVQRSNDEVSSADGIACAKQLICNDEDSEESRRRQEVTRSDNGRSSTRLRQRSVSLPSIRIGSLGVPRNFPSSASVNPSAAEHDVSRVFLAIPSQQNARSGHSDDGDMICGQSIRSVETATSPQEEGSGMRDVSSPKEKMRDEGTFGKEDRLKQVDVAPSVIEPRDRKDEKELPV